MDNKESCLVGEPHALGIFKTLFLFLKNHNFPKAADTLQKEWGLHKGDIDSVSNRSILLTRCKCSKTQANQTDATSGKYTHGWLEGTFQGETFHLKPDDTHIFYVCDHCQPKNTKSNDRKQRFMKNIDNERISERKSPRQETKNLNFKFSQLQEEHQKLIAVTSELTSALQLNVIGQTKNIHTVLEQCKTIYPSLFDGGSPRQNVSPSVRLEDLQSDEPKKCNNVKVNSQRAPQFNVSPGPQQVNLPSLQLERLSPRSPLMTPLAPETVRYILETVFERIFEFEKCKTLETNSKSPPLNKDEVENIVGDVLNEAVKPPPFYWSGEVEFSRSGSVSITRCKTLENHSRSPRLNEDDMENIVGDVLNETVKSPPYYGAGEGEFTRSGSISITRNNQNNVCYINYAMVKNDLMHSDNERKIRILQALRWRITKSEGAIREKVLESYVTNDVLDLLGPISVPERLLLGFGVENYVQESTCRLINTLASLKQGRDYLTSDERLLKRVLIKKVKDVRTLSGAVIRNMLVASVQKLSIRKQCRILMVNEGLFEVMVDYMDEFYRKLSKYCLEYCSALLMNLCLVDDAKNRSIKNPKKVIGLLTKFLEGENDCCIPYINGVMFSLFEKSEIINEAIAQNLDKTIIKLTQITDNESIKKQLDFILQSRLYGRSDPGVQTDDEDGKEEVDLLEVELDQDDFITQLPSGEQLLQEYKTDPENNNIEKNPLCVSFSTIKRDFPSSAKSFSEENKQFFHKPTLERGIFETAKPRRYPTCPQNVMKLCGKNKATKSKLLPATPLCYLETCQKLQNGNDAHCSCSKCVPGQSKYACGCYDAIREDIARNGEDMENVISSRSIGTRSSQFKSSQVTETSSAAAKHSNNISNEPDATPHPIEMPANTEESATNDNNDGGRARSGCNVCGEKKCECAFESRPKLCRTPAI